MLNKRLLMTGLLAMASLPALAQEPAPAQEAKRPGDRAPLQSVHPGWTLEPARPDGFEPKVGALCFLPDGKLVVTSFTPPNHGDLREEFSGTLYILDNVTATDPSQIKVTEIPSQLHEPLGAYWLDGVLYIADRNEVSKFTDTDGDGYPDQQETFASGWISDNYHHFTFGLPYVDGHFYLTLSTNITFDTHHKAENIKGPTPGLNGINPEFRGCLLKIDAETGEWDVMSGGLRTPNGVSLGPEGTILIPENQGAWNPASGVYVGEQGAFFGHYNNTQATSDFYPDGGAPSAFSDQLFTPPAVWLPQGEISNSPAEMIEIPQGQPHAGQFLMAEITLGGLKRIQLEKVNGRWQGCAFRHSQGFEAGLNRVEWGPDGCLYVGGMGHNGNWNWRGKQFGLQRMRPSGQTAFEYEKIEATADGFRISFTKPVAKEDLENISAYAINAWTYTPDQEYGGPKRDQHKVALTAAVAAEDGLSVELTIPDRKANYVYHFRTDPTSDAGQAMWTTEAWYTFHNAPTE